MKKNTDIYTIIWILILVCISIIFFATSISFEHKYKNEIIKYNNLQIGFNEYQRDTKFIVNSTVKLIYCEDLNNLFVGLDNEEVNKYVLKRYGAIFKNNTKNFILNNALYCDLNNTTCKKYKDNDWIVGRTICKNFNFRVGDLFE